MIIRKIVSQKQKEGTLFVDDRNETIGIIIECNEKGRNYELIINTQYKHTLL